MAESNGVAELDGTRTWQAELMGDALSDITDGLNSLEHGDVNGAITSHCQANKKLERLRRDGYGDLDTLWTKNRYWRLRAQVHAPRRYYKERIDGDYAVITKFGPTRRLRTGAWFARFLRKPGVWLFDRFEDRIMRFVTKHGFFA